MKIAILGSGSWGTALGVLLARKGFDILLLGHSSEQVEFMRMHRENSQYLPGFALPSNLIVGMLDDTPQDADFYILSVPSSALEEVATRYLPPNSNVLIATKGIQPVTGELLHSVVERVALPSAVAAISGPNLAVEITQGVPTATVIASKDTAFAERLAGIFNCSALRAYVSHDIEGTELSGALKNVLAISAGMSDGLGFGDNTKGALVARGLLEMTRFGLKSGAQVTTFFGIAGVGDLFATANSKLSRNYRVGYGLGQGRRLEEILEELGQVAEGVPTAEAVVNLCRLYQIELPIFEMTNAVIRGRMSPRDGVTRLMDRLPKSEGWDDIVVTSREPSAPTN